MAVVAFGAAGAFAAVQGGPHDITGIAPGSKSVCEPCHLPHGATGERLWAVAKGAAGAGWSSFTVSQLCGSCHYGDPAGGNGLTADTNVSNQTNYAYATGNHGYSTASLGTLGNGSTFDAATGTGLPYVDNAAIQCSTCHNPHDDTIRPFLRVTTGTVNTLCVLCHKRGVAAANLGSLNIGTQATGYSMHPMDIAYAATATAGADGIRALNTALFATSRGTATKGAITAGSIDHLGGKLQDATGTTGNIGCGTCHQVHGNGSSTAKSLWLTVTNNQLNGEATGLLSAELCEACHTGGKAGGTVINASTMDHPIDNAATGTAPFDSGTVWNPWTNTGRLAYETTYNLWPYASETGKSHEAACTSCHSAHYGVVTTPILRTGGDSTDWCLSCHAGDQIAPYGHHSNKASWSSSLIKCGDCHRGSTTVPDVLPATLISMSAHRNFESIDIPSGAPVSGRRANFCLKCHAGTAFTPIGGSSTQLGIQTGPTGTNLSTYNPSTGGSTTYAGPATHLTTKGTGSHRLGVIRTGKTALTVPRIGVWTSGFYSMYGAAGGGLIGNGRTAPADPVAGTDYMICESCHNILYNVGSTGNAASITASGSSGYANNLLLERYEDDASGSSGVGHTVGSMFCVGCHVGGSSGTAISSMTLNGNKPAGTHPVTLSVVTKAQAAGRAVTTLITATTGYANISGAPGIMSYPTTNEMDCDSCHRVHDAATNSSSTASAYVLEQATATTNIQSMCVLCHSY
jgi:predicted CXXCH cytochrome family protein